MRYHLCIIAALLFCVVRPVTAAPLQPETVRVAILKGADAIRLDGNGVLATDEQRMPLRITMPAQVRFVKGGVMVQGKTVRGLTLVSPATMLVNGKKYRGLVELIPAEKGGVVVNELPLEEYLIGLINCEISSQWPIDAIKAQAVIARSYALYQRDARKYALYHLESSVLDQVYDGADIEDSRAVRGGTHDREHSFQRHVAPHRRYTSTYSTGQTPTTKNQ